MTAAKLTGLPKGHGLTSPLNDLHHAAFDREESIEDIVAIVRLRATETSKARINQGRARGVKYEILRLEPVKGDEGQRLNLVLEDAYVARTSKGARVLPLDFGGRPDAERQAELNAEIREWADTQSLSPGQLVGLWNDYFAVGQGSDVAPFSPASSIIHLLDFARRYEIVKDEIQGDDPTEETKPDEPTPDAEPAEAAAEGSDDPDDPAWADGYPQGAKPEPVDA